MTSLVVVAHGGAGSTWQAMIVVAGVVLAGVLLAAASGALAAEGPGDLVLPLAGVAIASSLGVVAHEWISDAIGWALPLAVVSLIALVLATLTPLDVRFPAPLPMGALALALVGAVTLYQPLTIALHPAAELLPLADDASISIVAPVDGDVIAAGEVTVEVEVSGGSIGPGALAPEDLPDDPEESGSLLVAIEEVRDDTQTRQELVEVTWDAACTLDDPCTRTSFVVGVPPGTHELTTEFVRGDGTPLAPFVRDRVTFTVQ